MRFNSFMQNIDKAFQEFIPGVKHYRHRHDYSDWIFDGRISYTFFEKIRVAFIVKNIFNHEYVHRPADPQPPRMFMIQAGITL
jgi:outer membrane receptor protein involved in Fe transport